MFSSRIRFPPAAGFPAFRHPGLSFQGQSGPGRGHSRRLGNYPGTGPLLICFPTVRRVLINQEVWVKQYPPGRYQIITLPRFSADISWCRTNAIGAAGTCCLMYFIHFPSGPEVRIKRSGSSWQRQGIGSSGRKLGWGRFSTTAFFSPVSYEEFSYPGRPAFIFREHFASPEILFSSVSGCLFPQNFQAFNRRWKITGRDVRAWTPRKILPVFIEQVRP